MSKKKEYGFGTPKRNNKGQYIKNTIPTNKIILPFKKLRELYIEEKKGAIVIGRYFEVSKQTVYRNLREYNISIRKKGTPERLPEYWKEALRKPKSKPVWNKGLTKENNKSLKRISEILKGEKNHNWKPELYNGELIKCECGCGEFIQKYDKRGRIRHYKKNHSKKGRFKIGHNTWNKGKKWDSETIKKILTVRSPNKEESYLIELFKEYNFPYMFVGNGKVIIENRCPDFINFNGQKKIIEFFGEHWHKLEDEAIKRKIYAKYGYKTLFIWGKELRNKEELLNKIKIFNER